MYTQQRETTRLKKKVRQCREGKTNIHFSRVFPLSPMTVYSQTNLIAKVYGIEGMSNKRLPNYFES
jgi:hypothetical protein